MSEVSVLTAAHQPNEQYLLEAYQSLLQQDIVWQWVLQLDGSATEIDQLPELIRRDGRVHISANGHHLGAAVTRNLALLRCDNDLIQNLDADDTFYPNVLPVLAEAISPEGVAFAFGESHLTYADATQKHWQPAPWPEGTVEAGVIPDLWLATGRHHVSLSATMWKAVYLHAYGGWGAMKGMEDVYMLLAIADEYAGAYVSKSVIRYRVHDLQSTQQPDLLNKKRELDHRMLVAARILASRLLQPKQQDGQRPSFIEPHSGNRIALPFPFKQK